MPAPETVLQRSVQVYNNDDDDEKVRRLLKVVYYVYIYAGHTNKVLWYV